MKDPRSQTSPIEPANFKWKWKAIFERPQALEDAWQTWLAEAQREEQLADLKYWSQRSAA